MRNKIYMGIGIVCGIGFLIFALLDVGSGDGSGVGSDLLWAAISFGAAAALYYLPRRRKQRENSAIQ